MNFARASLVLFAFAASGVSCKRLPNDVPYTVSVGPDRSGPDKRYGSLHPLLGGELMRGSTVLGTFTSGDHESVQVKFTAPRSKLEEVLAEGYSVRLQGPCGPTTNPLKGPARFQSESAMAKSVEERGTLVLAMTSDLPEPTQVYVAWKDNPNAKIQLGSRALEQGTKKHAVSFAGCTGSVPVTIDGVAVESLPSHVGGFAFVSAAPGKCYLLRDAVYGEAKPRPEQFFSGKRAYVLPGYVSYVFEFAPSKTNVRGVGGTINELVAAPCRG